MACTDGPFRFGPPSGPADAQPLYALKCSVYRELARQARKRHRRTCRLLLAALGAALLGWGAFARCRLHCPERPSAPPPPEISPAAALPGVAAWTVSASDPVRLIALLAEFQAEEHLNGILRLPSAADPFTLFECTMTRRQLFLLTRELQEMGVTAVGGDGFRSVAAFPADPAAAVTVRLRFQ